MSRRKKVRLYSYALSAFLILVILALSQRAYASSLETETGTAVAREAYSLSCDLQGLALELRRGVNTFCDGTLVMVLSDVREKACSAQCSLEKLPLDQSETLETGRFLSTLSDYCRAVMAKSVAGGDVSEEREELRFMAAKAKELASIASTVGSDISSGTMTYSLGCEDTEKKPDSLSCLASDLEKAAGSFTPPEYDGRYSLSAISASAAPVKECGKESMSEGEAIKAAADFLGCSKSILTPVPSEDPLSPVFTFSAPSDVTVSVDKASGRIAYMSNPRVIGESVLSEDEAELKAEKLLCSLGYGPLTLVRSYTQGGIWYGEFVPRCGECLCFTDMVSLSVALDSGTPTYFDAHLYLLYNKERDERVLPFCREDVEGNVCPSLTVDGYSLVLVRTDSMQEKYLHAFTASDPSGGRYVLLHDADTGLEYKVLMLEQSDSGTLIL